METLKLEAELPKNHCRIASTSSQLPSMLYEWMKAGLPQNIRQPPDPKSEWITNLTVGCGWISTTCKRKRFINGDTAMIKGQILGMHASPTNPALLLSLTSLAFKGRGFLPRGPTTQLKLDFCELNSISNTMQ